MRKLFYICLLFTLTAGAQTSKTVPTSEYYYLFGGKNFDEARSIKELPDRCFIVAGTTSSFGQGNTSAYLVKTDSLGKHKWSNAYGGGQNDWAMSVEVTADSGYFVAGYSNSFNPPNGYDGWYFRTDKAGNLLWQKNVSGDDWDFIYGSVPLGEGFILCGETFTNSNGSADAWLLRIDKNGDTLWSKHFGGALDEKFNSVCIINNRIYATGSNITNAADTLFNAWVVKLDTNGNFISEKFFTGPNHYADEFKGITPYVDGSSLFISGKTELVDSGATQSLIAKMDTSLNFLIGPYLGGLTSPGEYVCFNRVINTSYGNICTMGTASGGLGGRNVFMVGYEGNLNWINDYAHNSGKLYDEYGYDGIRTGDGKMIFVGSAQQICTGNPNLGLEDVFLVRINGDSIKNLSITAFNTMQCFADTLDYWAVGATVYSRDLSLNLYPNPVTDKATLEIKHDPQSELLLHVYSVLGTEVHKQQVTSNGKNEIDLSGLDNGGYFLTITNQEGQKLSALKFIISK